MSLSFKQYLVFLCFVSRSFESPQSSFFGWSSGVTETSNQATPSVLLSRIEETTPTTKMENQQIFTAQTQPVIPVMPVSPPIQPATLTPPPIPNSNATLNTTTLPNKENSTSTLVNILGTEMTSYVTASVVFLGAALGREGCDLKAACLAGKLAPAVQGRDIALVAAEPLVPENWKMFYQAVKSSMIQGQDCSQYFCG